MTEYIEDLYTHLKTIISCNYSLHINLFNSFIKLNILVIFLLVTSVVVISTANHSRTIGPVLKAVNPFSKYLYSQMRAHIRLLLPTVLEYFVVDVGRKSVGIKLFCENCCTTNCTFLTLLLGWSLFSGS